MDLQRPQKSMVFFAIVRSGPARTPALLHLCEHQLVRRSEWGLRYTNACLG